MPAWRKVHNCHPQSIPRDFHLSRLAFDAVAERIVELPSGALREVVRLYGLVAYLNDLVVVYSEMLDQLRSAPEDAPYRKQLQREIHSAIEAFNVNLDAAFDAANATNRVLHKIAEPRWGGQPFVMADGAELKRRLDKRLADRDENLGQLERQRS